MDRQQVKSFLAVVGSIGTLLGLGLSIYFYTQSKEVRKPRYLVDPVRTEIVNAKRIQAAPIRILRTDGTEIRTDLTALRVYFWNAGNKAIKNENVLQPIRINLIDQNANIVDLKIINKSRDIINADLVRDPNESKRSVVLQFAILEIRDGVSVQIIYEGDPKAICTVDGIIEGPSPIIDMSPIRISSAAILRDLNAMVGILVPIGIVIVVYLKRRLRRVQGQDTYPKRFTQILLSAYLIIIPLLFASMVALNVVHYFGGDQLVPDVLLGVK